MSQINFQLLSLAVFSFAFELLLGASSAFAQPYAHKALPSMEQVNYKPRKTGHLIDERPIIRKIPIAQAPPPAVFDFETERKQIESKISELEKAGAGIKPYTQALANIDELSKKPHAEAELEAAVSKLKKALADQVKTKEMITLQFDSKTTAKLPNDEFKPFMTEVQRRIKLRWHPPHGPESKRVTVRFKIDRRGQLLANAIEKSASPGLDAAALKAVETSAPFPPLPKGSPENVDVQFTFDYNVFKHRFHPYMQPAHYKR